MTEFNTRIRKIIDKAFFAKNTLMSKISVESTFILIDIFAFFFNFDFIEIEQTNQDFQIFDFFFFSNEVIVEEETEYRRLKIIKDKAKRIKK